MIAEGFVRNGARVFIASRDGKQCEAAARALTAAGPGTCVGLAADLSKVAGCEGVVTELREKHGVAALHVLVNNSGASWGEQLEQFQEKGWDKIMDLNVKGIFFLTKAALPLLEAAGTKSAPARVINIGSIAGVRHQVQRTRIRRSFQWFPSPLHFPLLCSSLGLPLPCSSPSSSYLPACLPPSLSLSLPPPPPSPCPLPLRSWCRPTRTTCPRRRCTR